MRFAGSSPSFLETVQAMLSAGDSVPAQEIWSLVTRFPESYLLDPVALAERAGDARSIDLAKQVEAYAGQRAQRPVDRGSAMLDLFLRSKGVRSNLSGVASPPAVFYPIEPGVEYKREYRAPRAALGSPEKGTITEYIALQNVPMMDWDTPGPDHADRNVTVRHLGDVEELVRGYVDNHPESMVQLYQTPGGYRAWELGNQWSPDNFQSRFNELKVDEDYARLTTREPSWRAPDGTLLNGPAFNSRITHKPGRLDWVAQPLLEIAGRDAMPDPESVRMVTQYHDEPIRRGYLGPNGVSPAAVAALKRQLPSASSALRQQISRRFGL